MYNPNTPEDAQQKSVAKHLDATTLGKYPQLYPYVLEHLNETTHDKKLLDAAAAQPKAVMVGAPDVAAFLAFQLQVTGAKRVVEYGVFRGNTTLAMAQKLPDDGKIFGLDVSEEYAQLGMQAWKEAGVDHKIDFRVGKAAETAQAMIDKENMAGTIDLVFIDADKVNYQLYYEQALVLLKPGGLIALDNVLWHGRILQPELIADDADTKAILAVNKFIKNDKRTDAVMLPISDGVYLCRKL